MSAWIEKDVVDCSKKTTLAQKLFNQILARKTTERIECSTSCLFDSVSLIWSEHINVAVSIDEDCGENNPGNKYLFQERAMSGIVARSDSVSNQEHIMVLLKLMPA